MQRSLPNEARKVVPRWRELARTPGVELISARRHTEKPIASAVDDDLVESWGSDPSSWSALELVSAALVTGKTSVSDEAAKVLDAAQLPAGALRALVAYSDEQPAPDEEVFADASLGERLATIERVRSLRRALVESPKNPFLHVDIARNFASLGENEKAAQALQVAMRLAPENRYILRSATRFFVHTDKAEQVWQRLKNFGSSDPWIAAAKISIADLLGRPQTGVSKARDIIERSDASQTTELSAALGTIELGAGAIKKARKLFLDSARMPNDNAVAQIRWAHQEAGLRFDRNILKTDLSFEARTADAADRQDWTHAVANAKLWLHDEPFSSRAAQAGVFICAEYLQDFDQALLFCNIGLMANPNDPLLLNNRSFTIANIDLIEDAEADIKSVRSQHLKEEYDVFLLATEGCIAYRKGNPILGAELYTQSVNRAMDLKLHASAKRAQLHWLFEELRRGVPLDIDSATQLLNAFEGNQSVELKAAFDSLIRPLLVMKAQPDDIEEPRTTALARDLISGSP